ncbi:MAG: hypothetical protein M0C28_46040 [Candidatus Moduliflexus flocculans]|nr:hypothetical protein [Candidatus Moduliflexus flocculans]
MTVEWETEPVPADWTGGPPTFVWLAGHATGKGAHRFDLAVDGKKALSFRTSADSSRREWRETGLDGISLSVRDGHGRPVRRALRLHVARGARLALSGPGRPLRIEVTGEKAGSNDWFMVFRDDLRRDVWARSEQALVRKEGRLFQMVRVEASHLGAPAGAVVSCGDAAQARLELKLGYNALEFLVPAVDERSASPIEVALDDGSVRRGELAVQAGRAPRDLAPAPLARRHRLLGSPARRREEPLEILPGGDRAGREDGRAPRGRALQVEHRAGLGGRDVLPPGRRGREGGLHRGHAATARSGSRPRWHGRPDGPLPSRGARPSDRVRPEPGRIRPACPSTRSWSPTSPANRWSFVPALALAGIKYVSSGPNYMPSLFDGGDRIGWTLEGLGRQAVLLALAFGPGAGPLLDGRPRLFLVPRPQHGLARQGPELPTSSSTWTSSPEKGYPYSMVQVRYTVGGDNGPPDPELRGLRGGHGTRPTPRRKIVIATASEMFAEFERRHGALVPEVRGDFTGYWEDGAASTAKETAMARTSAGRLVQAEALVVDPGPAGLPRRRRTRRPGVRSSSSASTPGARRTASRTRTARAPRAQWEYKKAFAERAERMSNELLAEAAGRRRGARRRTRPAGRRRRQHLLVGQDGPRPRPAPALRRGRRPGSRTRRGAAVPSQRLRYGRAGLRRPGRAGIRGPALLRLPRDGRTR